MIVIDLGRKDEYNEFAYDAFRNNADPKMVAVLARIAIDQDIPFVKALEYFVQASGDLTPRVA